ncbi:PAS domain-containing sensor histidine kinase [Pseudoroseomonas ludipueritiae]|uniref:histidine kinase n=1 Tax=Pseudoroseomonas ludipueritiae TaxID=198093 RepID=A0ABR7R483_9PROT|nr:HAMP domain-containing sensor histidine kinase [Pseudoroseomonas ludipueritiae]MBC9176402.1 HAMP domain-containing histidine kinase [Pseudoroseomonas ludipueritiae]
MDMDGDAPGGRISTRPDGSILQANRTFLSWTGHDEATLLAGRRFQDLLTAAGRVFHDLRYLPALLLGGLVEEMDLDLLRADGQRLPVLASARLLRGAEGEPERILLSFTLATERRHYEEELLQARRRAEAAEAEARQALLAAQSANAAKGRFLSAMQHEFRTPIGLIMGYGELLVMGAAPAQQREYLTAIQDAAGRLLHLVDDAALYTEVLAATTPLHLTTMSIGLLTRQATQMAAVRLADAGLRVSAMAGPDLSAAMEPKLMRDGIASLMRELASHAPTGARLEVGWVSGEGGLELTLCCEALSPEVAARLQDPLSAENLHRRSLEGAGLGIAIAKQVMELHQGSLRLESTTGGGTLFRLTLPRGG